MKTTLEIDDQLLKAAKQRALDSGTTLREIVELALVQWLKPRMNKPGPVKTVVHRPAAGRRLQAPPASVIDTVAYDMDSARYWEKRFGYLPPGVKKP